MIGKIKKGSGFKGCVNYVLGKEQAVLLHADKSEEGLDAKDLKWLRAIAEEMPKSRAAALAAKVTGMKRDAIYQMLNAENSE